MKVRKLPSGAYNAQVYTGQANGKRKYKSITADTKAECEFLAAQYKQQLQQDKMRKRRNGPDERTVREVVDAYIKRRESANDPDLEQLAQSTTDGYRKTASEGFPDLMQRKICDLSEEICQAAIRKERKRISKRTGKVVTPHTVQNGWHLIAAALRAECKGLSFRVSLPPIKKQIKVLPPSKAILKAVKGKDCELATHLALKSLRQGEILALDEDSVQEGYIVVDKELYREQIIPRTKTGASVRAVAITPYIAKLIEQRIAEAKAAGEESPVRLVPMTRDTLYKHFVRAMAAEGYNMTFHQLRAVFATIDQSVLGIPEKETQRAGGWSTPSIMQSTYSSVTPEITGGADKLRNDYWDNLMAEIDAEEAAKAAEKTAEKTEETAPEEPAGAK